MLSIFGLRLGEMTRVSQGWQVLRELCRGLH